MIVLDANIVVRAVLGRRVRQLIEIWSAKGVRFLAPEVVFQDARRYLPELLEKRGLPVADLEPAISWLEYVIVPVAPEMYLPFEKEARLRLQGRDEDDWPILATALAFGCPVWTEDADFFGSGIATWVTSRVEIYFRAEVENQKPERSDIE